MDYQPNSDSAHSIDICSTKISSWPVQSNFTVDSIGVIKSCTANITRLSSNTWGSSNCGLALSPKSRMITKSSLATSSHHDFNHQRCHHHLNHVCNVQHNEIKSINSSSHCRYNGILNGQQQLRLDEYNYDYVHDVVADEHGDMISCTEPKVYSSSNLAYPVVDNHGSMPIAAIDASPPTPAQSPIINNGSIPPIIDNGSSACCHSSLEQTICCHSSLERTGRSPSPNSVISDFVAVAAPAAATAPVPPIRVVQIDNPVCVTTDATNFRSLVQKLTGKSGVSSKQWHKLKLHRKLKMKVGNDIEAAPALLESPQPLSDHLNSSWHQFEDTIPGQDHIHGDDDDDWNDYDVDQLSMGTTYSSVILEAGSELYMNQAEGQLAAAASSCSDMGIDHGHVHDNHGLHCIHTNDAHNQHYMDNDGRLHDNHGLLRHAQGQFAAAASSSDVDTDDGRFHGNHGLHCIHTNDAHKQHYMGNDDHLNDNHGLHCVHINDALDQHYMDKNAHNQHYMDNAHIHEYVAELGEPTTDQDVGCSNDSIQRCNQSLLQRQCRQNMVMRHHSEEPFSELDIYAGLVSDGPLPDITVLPPLLKNLPEHHHHIHHHHRLLAPPAHNTAYMPVCI